MDIDKLLEILQERGLLEQLSGKRLSTNEIPATTYIKLLISEIGTGKSITANLGTAIATYLARNQDNHIAECKAKALIAGKEVEEAIADLIEEKLKRRGDGNKAQGD